MNQGPQSPPAPNEGPAQASDAPAPVLSIAPFFQRTDWLSFGITTALVLAVYLFTLAPEVTLDMSGELSTAAMYAGVPHPPGFPLFAIYTWLFTKLLPFSNIAWRAAVSLAVAGALTCGLIALMVSRGGAAMVEGIPRFRRLEGKEERLLRLVCGSVAGMGFGFATPFWGLAVEVDTRPLGICLFSIVLCLLSQWLYAPDRARYLYGAFFVYGLTISASQMLIPAALGLPFFVMFGDQRIGRELFFATAVLAAGVLVAKHLGGMPILEEYSGQGVYYLIGGVAATMCAGLIVRTRGFFTKCWPALVAGVLCILGMLPHIYLPLASMTNPPMNWGYARTVEGFIHVLNRGQYEHFNATGSVGRLLQQLIQYGEVSADNVGLIHLLPALVPFCFLPRMRARERGLMLGLLAFFLSLSVFMVFALNPPPDKQAQGLMALFLPPSYLVLAIWSGYGLVLLGSLLAGSRRAVSP